MLQVRLQQDVVELLRQVYVAYGNCFSEKRGNLPVLERSKVTTISIYELLL